ncbi:hypothetical protein Tco_0454556 [Tanacetum coccineum]
MPLGDHTTHWSNLLGEIVMEFLMHYASWHKILTEWKAGHGHRAAFGQDLHRQQVLTGLTTWKESDPDVPRTSPRHIRMRILPFGLILKTLPEPLKIDKTGQRAWSYADRVPGHLLSSEIYRELRHSRVEERLLYEEMLRLKDLGPNTPTGVPYTDDEIKAMVHRGKQRGHIHGVGRVVRSDDKISQLLIQLQSHHKFGSGSGSGGGGDDESGEDEDSGEDKDADGDEDS